jgi:2-oxoisovalerate dehydrogenase E2 component (dihydrolipoyl transacylase)
MRPILVVPEIMIGALGSFRTLPRYDAAMNLQPTKIMNMSWTGDHRIIDGATAARFHSLFKSYIEQPNRIILDTR